MSRRDRLRRTGCWLLIIASLVLATFRAFGAFGDPLVADGGLLAILILGATGAVLYPTEREEHPGARRHP